MQAQVLVTIILAFVIIGATPWIPEDAQTAEPAQCVLDQYEPNDTLDQALYGDKSVPTNGAAQAVGFHSDTDQDWYRFYVNEDSALRVVLTNLTGPYLDIGCVLYSSTGHVLYYCSEHRERGEPEELVVQRMPYSGIYMLYVWNWYQPLECHGYDLIVRENRLGRVWLARVTKLFSQ